MRRLLFLISLTLLFLQGAQANNHMEIMQSPYGVDKTIDRFELAVKKAGMNIFARIDHAQAAEKVGMQLRPTQLLIFGNPKVGTKLMQSNQQIGIDLPLKALAWEDDKGAVWLGYYRPADLLAAQNIADRPKVGQKMAGALAKFAAFAIRPEAGTNN